MAPPSPAFLSSSPPSRVDLSPSSSDEGGSACSFCEVVRDGAPASRALEVAGGSRLFGATSGSSKAPPVVGSLPSRLASMVVRPNAPARIPVAERLEPVVRTEEEWHVTGKKRPRQRRKVNPVLPSRAVPKEMAPLMADRCFNCLGEDHVAALCPNETRCRKYFSSGHRGSECRNAYASPPRILAPCSRVSRAAVAAPPAPAAPVVVARTPPKPATSAEVSAPVSVPVVLAPAARVWPLAPAPLAAPLVSGPLARPSSGHCILPRSPALNEAEASVSWSLVVNVVAGRGRVPVSAASALIARSVPEAAERFSLHSFLPAEFLCVCSSEAAKSAILEA